ncbi:MAG: cell envelope integrity protein CreD [Flavobacteriales bacterium]|nr:cell envelope integrity protein CreD [Flavobacteriales bacterium]
METPVTNSESNQNMSAFDRFNRWLSGSVTVRIFSVAILVLLLMIPNSMIRDIIRERKLTSEDAVSEVSSKWGYAQTVVGPVLSVPYLTYTEDKEGNRTYTKYWSHFLPDDLSVNAEVASNKRKRSIYEVVVYTSDMTVSGKFKRPDPELLNIPKNMFLLNEAIISMGIPDMRGIGEKVNLTFGDTLAEFGPGIPTSEVFAQGISARMPIGDGEEFPFKIGLELRGSRSLSFVPIGRATRVDLRSDWPHPSFNGAFLPDHEVTDQGFSATWKVLDLNRNFPQQWKGQRTGIYDAAFGFELFMPNDHYQQSMRSAKYAILFISLTFMVFFFMETINKKRIHPIQYILVGLALSLFFVLILSLSEFIGFSGAYLIGAIGTTLLITIYSSNMLTSFKLTAFLGGLLTVMYGFIYIILQLEDTALLVGSIGLFLILATIMLWSRKVDWYRGING